MKTKARQYREQYSVFDHPDTGSWVVGQQGTGTSERKWDLVVLPVLSLRDNFTNERDAELYILSTAEEMIDKLLQNTNSELQEIKY